MSARSLFTKPAVCLFMVLFLWAGTATAASKIYVVDPHVGLGKKGMLFGLADVTGQRSVVTNFGVNQGVLSKHQPRGKTPTWVAVEADGNILVLDQDAGSGHHLALFRVNANTGDRTVLSDFGDGSQGVKNDPNFFDINNLAVALDGSIWVVAHVPQGHDNTAELIRIDPVTGMRQVISDFSVAAQGPICFFSEGGGLAVDVTEEVLVSCNAGSNTPQFFNGLMKIDPGTGMRHAFSDFANGAQGSGFAFGLATGIALGLTGDIYVSVRGADSPPEKSGILRIDPATGVRTLITDFRNSGQGVEVTGSVTIATLEEGPAELILVTGVGSKTDPIHGTTRPFPAVFAVNASTGQRRATINDFTNAAQGPTSIVKNAAGDSSGSGTVYATAINDAATDGYVFKIDLGTGMRSILSDFNNAAQWTVGFSPFGIAVDTGGSLLVTDRGLGGGLGGGALWSINSTTGARTKLSDFGNALQGPVGVSPEGVALDASGNIFVVDSGAGTDCFGFGGCGALFRIDRITGTRTLISDFGNSAQGPLGNTGPTDLVRDTDGTFLVIDPFAPPGSPSCDTGGCGSVFRVDPSSGMRALVTALGDATQGPNAASRLEGVTVTKGGIIAVAGCPGTGSSGSICSVDRITGVRTLLSDFGNPAEGPTASFAMHLAIYP